MERVIGSEVDVSQSTPSVGAEGRIYMTIEVPAVNEGKYVKYRVFGIDSFSNATDASNVVSFGWPANSNWRPVNRSHLESHRSGDNPTSDNIDFYSDPILLPGTSQPGEDTSAS